MSERAPHGDMRDTRLQEWIPFHHESGPFVERLRMALRVQHGALETLIDGATEQCIQQCRTNALPSPHFQNRHSPDVSVWQQPAGSNCLTGVDHGERMHANRIEFIHLDLYGNALLFDEHRLPDRHGQGSCELPGEEPDLHLDGA